MAPGRRGPALVGALAAFLAASTALHVRWLAGVSVRRMLFVVGVVETVLLLLVTGLLAAAAVWLDRSEYDVDDRVRVGQWCVAGALLVAGSVGAVKVHQLVATERLAANAVQTEMTTAAGAGGVLGFLVGRYTTDARRRAATVAEQRDAFDFLNRVLRHHVLNGVTVIGGYADRLDERTDGGERDLDVIRRRSRAVAALVADVEVVSDAFAGTATVEPVDVVEVVRTEVAVAREETDARIETALPERAVARANAALSVVVENLLRNAVEHNDAPTVRVGVERDDAWIRVRVADDGDGLPPDVRGAPFEPGDTGDSGFGLYLASTLVEAYGGTIHIADGEEAGTVVVVALERAPGGTLKASSGEGAVCPR